jgi:DNA recombination protein RmuC
LARLLEKVSTLESLTETSSQSREELARVAERIGNVEKSQQAAVEKMQKLDTQLAGAGATTGNLVSTANAIREELTKASQTVAELKSAAEARQEVERKTSESIRRLENIIAGTQSRGAAGENILDIVFSRLPAEWKVHNYRVAGGSVEFGLRLPNGRVLPIDSKWPAAELVQKLSETDDPNERARLQRDVERAVKNKASEVRKYIDPDRTLSFGVAAVPDAVYDLCTGLQAEVVQMNVVLVSYSMFMPYLLLVFQTVLMTSQDVDIEKLNAYVKATQDAIQHVQDEVDGRLSRTVNQLSNSRDELRLHAGKAATSLVGIQSGPVTLGALPEGEDDVDDQPR